MIEKRHLRIVDLPDRNPKILEFKTPGQAEFDDIVGEFSAVLYAGWLSILSRLEVDEAAVVWGLLSLKSEEEIAEEIETSSLAVERIRNRAEQKLGGELPF